MAYSHCSCQNANKFIPGNVSATHGCDCINNLLVPYVHINPTKDDI